MRICTIRDQASTTMEPRRAPAEAPPAAAGNGAGLFIKESCGAIMPTWRCRRVVRPPARASKASRRNRGYGTMCRKKRGLYRGLMPPAGGSIPPNRGRRKPQQSTPRAVLIPSMQRGAPASGRDEPLRRITGAADRRPGMNIVVRADRQWLHEDHRYGERAAGGMENSSI